MGPLRTGLVAGALVAALAAPAGAVDKRPVRGEVGFDIAMGSLAGWDGGVGGGLSLHVARRAGRFLLRGELTAGMAARGPDPMDTEQGALQRVAAVGQYTFASWREGKQLSFHLYAEAGVAREWLSWERGSSAARSLWLAGAGADYVLMLGQEGRGRAHALRAFLGVRLHGVDEDRGAAFQVGFAWGW